MKRMTRAVRVLLACSVVALGACGGGGGGGGGGGDSGGSNDPGTTTGLVPAATAPGTVLQADATVLMPLRDGSTWHYHGYSPSGSAGSEYGVMLTLAAGTAGDFLASRKSTRAYDDFVTTYQATPAGVGIIEPDGPAGAPVSYPLLRSPVRQGDQATVLDQKDADLEMDADGDRVNDRADVGVYWVVRGIETVNLPEIGIGVPAVRVDTHYRVRLKLSGTSATQPVYEQVQSSWYAAGIGEVRSTLTEVSENGTDTRLQLDERLAFWDGITEGRGALPPTAVTGAQGAALFTPWSAVPFGNGALIGTTYVDQSNVWPSSGFVLTAIDARGATVAGRSVPSIVPARDLPLLPLAGGVGVIAVEFPPAGAPGVGGFKLRLWRFDANLQPAGPSDGTLLLSNLPTHTAMAASDGNRFWLMWVDTSAPASGFSRLWLRLFDAAGQPLAPAQLLDSQPFNGGEPGSFGSLSLAASSGQAIASWGTHVCAGCFEPQVSYAVSNGFGTPAIGVLGTSHTPSGGALSTVAAPDGWALAWAESQNFRPGSQVVSTVVHAVAVRADASLLRSAAATLDDEVLALAGGARLGTVNGGLSHGVAFADGARFGAIALSSTTFDPSGAAFTAPVFEIDSWPFDVPFAGTAPTQVLRRTGPFGFPSVAGPDDAVRWIIPLADRQLVLRLGGTAGLTSTVLFR